MHTLVRNVSRALGVVVVVLAMPVAAQEAAAYPEPAQAPAVSAPTTPRGGPVESPLGRPVSLDMRDVTLKAALDEIDRQAKLGLTYTPRLVPVERRVTVSGSKMSAGEALARALEGTDIVPVVTSAGMVMLVRREAAAPARQDTTAIYGVITAAGDGRLLGGAVVAAKGTLWSTVTTSRGHYALLLPPGKHTVTVRLIGYRPSEIQVTVGDSGATEVNLALEAHVLRLDELVTTATGTKRRLEVSNDITVLDVDSILATAPITSVTDLLEGRVPGLIVQRTSGAPGDPARLRLRGVSSVRGNNDPIVIVDGVRMYAAQSDARGANLAADPTSLGSASVANQGFPAPSPLDQVDPNSLEKVEVLAGPSAATLYGADAANGVLVITTKKGRPGPARWTMRASHGREVLPGRYPDALFRWGHTALGETKLCPLTDFSCTADSLVRFQALNQPDLTLLGKGSSSELSLGVSGGNAGLTYALTGSYQDQTGLLKLPSYQADRFVERHGEAPPEWMERPHALTRWGGTSRLGVQLGAKADVSLTAALSRSTQQRSSLESQLTALMGTYVDRGTGTYYQAHDGSLTPMVDLVPDFARRATDVSTNFTTGANVTWRPRGWLTTSADAGVNVINREDEVLLPRGLLNSVSGAGNDSVGTLSAARGNSVVSTVNLRAVATAPLRWGLRLELAAGANYTRTSSTDLRVDVRDLAPGTTSMNGAGKLVGSSSFESDITNFGWYLAPSLAHQRFVLSAGLRLDGGSTYGDRVALPTFPKLGGSWLVSDEPWFPLGRVFSTLRLRAAYGHAGVQPGIADRLRLYRQVRPWVDGGPVVGNQISALGNTQLKPERSTEFEGGFDADVLDGRVSVTLTGYRKTRKDALMSVPVAPSVYGNTTMLKNIGVVRNTGLAVTLGTELVRTTPVTWSSTLTVSRNRNVVAELGSGVEPFTVEGGRVVAGYPLFGRWARPIRAYADVNGNGVIERTEVQLGDTLVFMGETVPNYEATLHTTFSLLRGALVLDAGFDYQDGLTQVNVSAATGRIFSPAQNDPAAPFGEQAAVAVMSETDYGLTQTVNTLRFNSLSVRYAVPNRVARLLGAEALSVAVQGSNLGLHTNYTGKDPNVNAYGTGNGVADGGQLPRPRSWFLSVNAIY